MIFVLFFCRALSSGDYAILFGRGAGIIKAFIDWARVCERALCMEIDLRSLRTSFMWQHRVTFFVNTLTKIELLLEKDTPFPAKKTNKTNSAHVVCACGTFFFLLWVMVIMRCGHTVPGIPLDDRPFPLWFSSPPYCQPPTPSLSLLFTTRKKYFRSSTFWNPNPTPSPGVIFPFWYTGDQQEVELLCVCEIFHYPAQQSCTRPLIPNKETSSEWTNQLPAYALLVCLHFFTPLNRIHLF